MKNDPSRSDHHPESVKYPGHDPKELLDHYLQGHEAINPFLTRLMNCIVTHDIASILRCVPADLFSDFKKLISQVASLENEEDFFVIGGPISWGVDDARKVMRWLTANPNPILAPPAGRLDDLE